MEERKLIELCIERDSKAQHELFKKFAGRFLGILVRYLKDRNEASEVLQNGFIKIFSNLHKFKFEGN